MTSLRNFAVATAVCWVKKPEKIRDLSSLLFRLADLLTVALLLIYGEKAVFSQEVVACRDNGNPDTFKWWVVSVSCFAYDAVLLVYIVISLVSMPLTLLFWCFQRISQEQGTQ